MTNLIMSSSGAINTTELQKLAQKYPQYTQLLLAFAKIDGYIKGAVESIVSGVIDDPFVYYIKTELSACLYTLYLFNAERNAIAGYTWPLTTFLALCQSKTIDIDVQNRVDEMLKVFDKADIRTGNDVNWIT